MSPRRASRRGTAGFTLVEILVVVLIAGLLVGMATLSIGAVSATRGAAPAAEKYAAVVEFARDEALFTGTDLGLWIADDGFSFAVRNATGGAADAWQALEGRGREFAPREYDDLTLEIEIEGRRVGGARRTSRQDGDPPDVLIFASGEITPHRLTFDDGRRRVTAGSDGITRVVVEGRAPDTP